jgi:hypothetical protein
MSDWNTVLMLSSISSREIYPDKMKLQRTRTLGNKVEHN